MKKIILFVFMCVSVFCFSTSVLADGLDLSQYNASSLEDTFADEDIDYNFDDYDLADDAITIYLFRGHGCSHCLEFLNYLADTLLDKYAGKIDLISYEVWNDTANADLFEQVADFMGDSADGVPYIVIGDKTFIGYSESMNDDITSAIEELLASDSRYDVFDELSNSDVVSSENDEASSANISTIVICNIIIMILGIVVIVIFNNRNQKELLEEIENLKLMLSNDKNYKVK